MRIDAWLERSQKLLQSAQIPSARLDCLILLEDALSKDRATLLAYLDTEIPHSTELALNTKVVQRSTHLPLAYIRGKVHFYGREFIVNKHVLVPRPETEAMISLAKNISLTINPTILDVGTGSGCIGITLALEIPNSRVYLYDIDNKALGIACLNAKKYDINASVTKQNLMENAPSSVDLLVTNLPYVPTTIAINKDAEFEPHHAIFSGDDGLSLYRSFWDQAGKHRPKHILTESLPSQHDDIKNLAQHAGYKLVNTLGFAQHFSLEKQQP